MSDDQEAWHKYPKHRKWFNKLFLAMELGYDCGPCGVAPTKTGVYVVRPTYNLSGMGFGARLVKIEAGDTTKVPAGYFWCEYFRGKHYSATYEWHYDRDNIWGQWRNPWKGMSCWEGINFPLNLSKFTEWKKSDYIPRVPDQLVDLRDVGRINVEFIDDKVIEVHLRDSPDPQYEHIIPIWKSDTDLHESQSSKCYHLELQGYKWISDYDDADGQLSDPRLGFMVK